MTNITTIIDQESGIQYQGVEDRSSRTGTYPVIGLIAGQFRRGRFDKPMTITNENIKAQLGYDPTNPHYMAVQDGLSSGVPSVQVLRVAVGGDCDCESDILIFSDIFNSDPMPYGDATYTLTANGVAYVGSYNSTTGTSIMSGISAVFEMNSALNDILSYYQGSSNGGQLFLSNQLDDCLTISLDVRYVESYGSGAVTNKNYINNISLCAKSNQEGIQK